MFDLTYLRIHPQNYASKFLKPQTNDDSSIRPIMLKNDNKLRCKSETLKLVDDVPDKDVELFLEVEMDDEVKEIITSPEKYASTLLDVTVIKPKDIDKLYTSQKNTMTGDAVRKFMQAMNLDGNGKQTMPSREVFPPKASGDHQRPAHKPTHIYTTDDTNSEISSTRRGHQRLKQVYTTPKTFHEQIKANFECKKNRKRELNEKLNTPCVCQNCAIVGVMTDSQKKPFATESMYDPREPPVADHRRRKKLDNDHAECQYYFKHLNEKIKHLEARIAVQEEKSVPKDYFRRIITKLVTHITKISAYGNTVKLQPSSPPRRSKHDHTPRFVVNPILVDTKPKAEASPSANPFLWRWGEEILKPGIDLKNKIIVLMEDTLNNLKRTKERTKEEEIKNFVNEFSSNLYKTVHEVPERDKPKAETRRAAPGEEGGKRHRKRLISKLFRKEAAPDDPISVEYVNSKVLRWQDTETAYKFDSLDRESGRESMRRRTSDLYRTEFTKTLLNTKNEDRVKLWHSIWNQASANGQSKNDKVTIQLPDKRDPKNKNIEIMYALGDLERLLIGKKVT